VTDPHDRRLIKIILKQFYSPAVLEPGFKVDGSGLYRILDDGAHGDFMEYIRSLPKNDGTDVFGLNPNAEISSAIIETTTNCETILSLLPRDVSSAGSSPEDIIKEKIRSLLEKLPKPFDVVEAAKKHPVRY
jgi:dynein heavy chain